MTSATVAVPQESRIYRWFYRATQGLRVAAGMGALLWLSLKAIPRTIRAGRFPVGEFIQQCWFVAYVTIIPAMLITVPFGIVVALQIGGIANQLGAGSFMGAANGLAILQQVSPMVTALLVAGAAGTAMCSDLGARKIREELDALEVMGIDPVERLVMPRMLASTVVSVLLQSIVSFGAMLTAYIFSVRVADATPGGYFQSMGAFAETGDFFIGAVKAFIFGFLAAVIACYRGMRAAGGPRGVADAVNQTAVAATLALIAVNVIISQIQIVFFPPKIAI